MENRLKEQQLGLFAGRMSCHEFRANQMRVWLHGFAYVLMNALRQEGLVSTELEKAQIWTIRERLLKVGCVIRQSVRRIKISWSSAYPWAEQFRDIRHNLEAWRNSLAFDGLAPEGLSV